MDSFGWGLNQETPLNTPTVEDISVVDARFYFWQVGVERSCGVLPSVQLLIVWLCSTFSPAPIGYLLGKLVCLKVFWTLPRPSPYLLRLYPWIFCLSHMGSKRVWNWYMGPYGHAGRAHFDKWSVGLRAKGVGSKLIHSLCLCTTSFPVPILCALYSHALVCDAQPAFAWSLGGRKSDNCCPWTRDPITMCWLVILLTLCVEQEMDVSMHIYFWKKSPLFINKSLSSS